LTALREVFASFGIDFDREGALTRGNAQVESTIESLRGMASTIAGAFAFQQARDFVRTTVDMGSALDDTRQILGITSQELQQWQHVARLSGAEVGEFTSSFVRLQNRMAQGGAGAEVFRRLGVDIRDANGELRNASDVLSDLADPIAAIGSAEERTGVLMDLLGRSGARLGPLFSRGSAGIAEVRAELAALGGGMSAEAIQASADLGDAWDRLDVISLSLRSRLATLLLPALEWLSRGVATLTNNSNLLEGVLVALGLASLQLAASTAATWGPLALGAARALLPIIAVALVVDDLITLFQGGHSVIGDAMDLLGGDGTQIEFVEALRAAWLDVVGVLRDVRDFTVDLVGGPTDVGEMTAGGEVRAGTRGLDQSTAISAEESAYRAIRSRNLVSGRSEADMRAEARASIAALAPTSARASAPATTTTIDRSITIQRIDASGLTEAQATRAVQSAVRAELDRQASDSLDTLARGAVE
jgi:hypothetical protein